MLDKIIGKNKYDSAVDEAAKVYVLKFRAQIVFGIIFAVLVIIDVILSYFF
jgi:hypothetical protein